jgi:hypothetical protein
MLTNSGLWLTSEEHKHSSNTTQSKRSPTNFVDTESRDDRGDPIEDLQDTVDQGLIKRGSDTNCIEDLGQVVAYETVSGPLTEECQGHDNSHSL